MASMSRAASNAEAALVQAHDDAMRKRAARQAALKLKVDAPPVEIVECVVLPKGHARISMGEHFAGLGDAFYEEDEKFSIQLPIAVDLYDRGYVNFPNAREASEAVREERARIAAELREAARRAMAEAEHA